GRVAAADEEVIEQLLVRVFQGGGIKPGPDQLLQTLQADLVRDRRGVGHAGAGPKQVPVQRLVFLRNQAHAAGRAAREQGNNIKPAPPQLRQRSQLVRGHHGLFPGPGGNPPRRGAAGYCKFRSRARVAAICIAAGPRITRNRPGKMQKIVGNNILTAAFWAISSAYCSRLLRRVSACVRSALTKLAPKRSDWMMTEARTRKSSRSARWAKCLRASPAYRP